MRRSLILAAVLAAACASTPVLATAAPPPRPIVANDSAPPIATAVSPAPKDSVTVPTKVFWLEPTAKRRHELRRYANADCAAKPYGMSYHDARVTLGIVDAPADDLASHHAEAGELADPAWPAHCQCGYAFTAEDTSQINFNSLYEAKNGPYAGQLFTLRDAPPGAMWNADWLRSHEPYTGPDGIALVVKLPNGSDWMVDQQCSNCTRDQYGPQEIDGVRHDRVWLGRTHYCWVRHGDPRTGELHVDKNGNTCSAGGGSILSGNYHGFLHNGYLTDG